MRKGSPWYWSERSGWYVTLNHKRYRIGPHPEGAGSPRKSRTTGLWNVPQSIRDAFHQLTQNASASSNDSVSTVLNAFSQWNQTNRAAKTSFRYDDFIKDFTKGYGHLPVAKLTANEVWMWLGSKKTWNSTTKRNAIVVLTRGFNWAVKNRGLLKNPIKGMEKPEAESGLSFVQPDEFEKLLAAIPDQRFRDVLILTFDTGARPQEIKMLACKHVQFDKRRAVFPRKEAKGRNDPRVVYFPTDRSWEIILRLAKESSEGPMLRNRRGRPWTGMAVKCRLEDLDHVLGRRVTHTSLRHSKATDWLASGLDSHIVAKLLGHKDSRMLDRVYGHVQDDHTFMLKKAQGKNPEI